MKKIYLNALILCSACNAGCFLFADENTNEAKKYDYLYSPERASRARLKVDNLVPRKAEDFKSAPLFNKVKTITQDSSQENEKTESKKPSKADQKNPHSSPDKDHPRQQEGEGS